MNDTDFPLAHKMPLHNKPKPVRQNAQSEDLATARKLVGAMVKDSDGKSEELKRLTTMFVKETEKLIKNADSEKIRLGALQVLLKYLGSEQQKQLRLLNLLQPKQPSVNVNLQTSQPPQMNAIDLADVHDALGEVDD